MIGKIILFTILILLAIILIILILPLGFVILYDNEILNIDIKIFNLIKIHILPSKENEKKKIAKRKKKKSKLTKSKSTETIQETDKKKKEKNKFKISEIIKLINDILPLLGNMLYKWLKGITVTKCTVSIVVYNEDFSKTGKKCGELYGELYGGYTMLSHYINIQNFKPMVTPNYINDYSSTYAVVCGKVRPITIIGAAITFLLKGGKKIYNTFAK